MEPLDLCAGRQPRYNLGSELLLQYQDCLHGAPRGLQATFLIRHTLTPEETSKECEDQLCCSAGLFVRMCAENRAPITCNLDDSHPGVTLF